MNSKSNESLDPLFHVYVLRSENTGRRYVGSCKDLDKRIRRHNAGMVSATKHAIPWILVHNETFLTRGEAIMRERYFKTGKGRDELDRIDSRSVTATAHLRVAVWLTGAVLIMWGSGVRAQDAAQSSVDLQTRGEQSAVPTATPANPPDVPELSKLDEAFKQTSLGRAADEYRLRIEVRRLQNLVVNDPAVVAAKDAAESARTDLEKRQRLREYYNIYYGRMRALTSNAETQGAVDKVKAEHLVLLNQPRVRHETDGALPTPPPRKKHKKKKQGD
jgi:putative endonuclease